MKHFLLLTLLISVPTFIYSQTLKETQDWIKEKISGLEFSDEYVDYNYNINFINGQLIINEEINISQDLNLHVSTLKNLVKIPASQINEIAFHEQDENVWLVIKTKNNLKLIEIQNSAKQEKFVNEHALVLGKEVLKNNLESRLTKAFRALVSLSGGENIKDVF